MAMAAAATAVAWAVAWAAGWAARTRRPTTAAHTAPARTTAPWPPSCRRDRTAVSARARAPLAVGFKLIAHTTARGGRRRTQTTAGPATAARGPGRQRGCTALDEAPAPPTSNPIRHALHLRRDHCSAHPRRPRSTCRLCRACTCARSPTPTQQSIGKNTQGVERMVLHVHHVDMPQMRRCATRLLNDGDQQRVAHEQLFHVDTRPTRHKQQSSTCCSR